MSQVLTPKNKSEATDGLRYLSFSLGSEDYGIPLLSVKEVIALPEITPMPFTPAYFLGIMNLRGQVISVVDLRQKFGVKTKSNAETAVIICDLGDCSLGVVVDSINSVFLPSAKDVSEKPDIQSSVDTKYITGICKREHQLTILIDIVQALSPIDQKTIGQMSQPKKAA